jgi:LacI family transcriptional regulator
MNARNAEDKTRQAAKASGVPHVLLLIDTSGSVGRGMIEGIARYSLEHGSWSIQYEYRTLESLPPRWLEGWRGDGILCRTTNARQAKLLEASGVPFVELYGDPKIIPAHVTGDPQVEGNMIADFFLNLGLRHFAYFSYGRAWWIRWYTEGFCAALDLRGYRCSVYRPPCRERNVPLWNERMLPSLTAWLKSLPRPIGIFTPGDLHAVRLLNVCRELDIAVPEEVAILGRGNDPVICETTKPTLSSLDVDSRRVGYEAAALLDRMMAGKKMKGAIRVPASHVAVRQSTDLMAIEDPDVVQAIRFIRENACENIGVPRVAQEVSLSRRILELRFQKHLGRSPKAEILRLRIETAKKLLSETDKNRQGIAHQCGFATPEYFSKIFHRMVGMTPNTFRKKSRVSRELGNVAK